MITISLCMIVKNEESVLARCLDSVADLVDEIVIVDTGSTDKTKEIAAKYTDKIYDFVWIDDFSAARNFAFSKANMEYIYSADADEVLDGDNRERFRILKENLLPEIELVQMKYGNQLQFGTVYNFDEEYRPKLFKRKRDFIWEEPIHETVRISPVIYDSDVVITHMPEQNHAGRDLANFRKQTEKGLRLSKRLHNMYARELFLAGNGEDFVKAAAFFRESAMDESRDEEELVEACLVAARAARVSKDAVSFFKYASKIIAGEGCSEICCELGFFYEDAQDYTEAVIWYYNAVYETAPVLKKTAGDVEGLEGLIRCYEKMGQPENAQTYREELHVLRKGMKIR
ncbi:MAG: glycosyltransferase family 2 protein [Bacteroidales bacterium]|nr:glycosyltransferase family 2 protein [Lachnoclostridium sp.]MCM1383770.1 glycosyltransferase family 2 protein [Lachnoclostridium sp.]MCM1464398.1 glycosyltransferase family 2 protein [Bacteroidales bacterium]